VSGIILLLAYVLDRWIGDPQRIPHPVILIGKAITRLESLIRFFIKADGMKLKATGLLFPLIIVGGVYAIMWHLLDITYAIHPWLAYGLEIWMIATTIAAKGLADAGREIYRILQRGNLMEARKALAMVVGRDTEKLTVPEISRGAVETVAENIVDAIVSPLFYAAIGGAPLAMAYRAVNTLDSMVGYRNEHYKHLGWASARLDDAANYLPARLTAPVLIAVCWFMKLDYRNAWRVIRRDSSKHPSPNSGITEAGVAGALSIQLGGVNYYQGVASYRALLGDPVRPLTPEHIETTVKIMLAVATTFLVLCMGTLWLLDLVN
jgi:adenosylcobinamide-phosphate synthase